jgi:Flp pilus assembly protein TadG
MPTSDAHRGQSTVEFALLLPLVVMCVALIFLVVAVTQAQLTVVSASRNAVRSAIMHNHSAADSTRVARSAAHDTSPLRPLRVDVTAHDDFLTVTVSAKWRLPVPVLGKWIPRFTLTSSSTMLSETTDGSP